MRALFSTVLVAISCLAAFGGPAAPESKPLSWQEPSPFVSLAVSQARRIQPQAELFSIDSVAAKSSEACAVSGWNFIFFADVDASRDASGVEKIEVQFQPFMDREANCLWSTETQVTHRDPKPWGMLPLGAGYQSRAFAGAQAAATKYLGGEFTLKDISIFHPDLPNVPAGMLLNGEFCNQQTYMLVNAANGEIYDAPVKPTCH